MYRTFEIFVLVSVSLHRMAGHTYFSSQLSTADHETKPSAVFGLLFIALRTHDLSSNTNSHTMHRPANQNGEQRSRDLAEGHVR